MPTSSLQQIAVAVTPAVMVSACALIALGLDNQISRISSRLRELIKESRTLSPDHHRRTTLKVEVRVLAQRHHRLARALLLDYLALFTFILTSLLALIQARLADLIPEGLPLLVFAIGVFLLMGGSLFAISSIYLARIALRLEEKELLGNQEKAN